MNIRLLVIALCIGLAVSIKRTWMGYFLGRKTYSTFEKASVAAQGVISSCVLLSFLTGNYSEDLAKVMKKIVLLSKVATLATHIESQHMSSKLVASRKTTQTMTLRKVMSHEKVASLLSDASFDENNEEANDESLSWDDTSGLSTPFVIDPDHKNKLTGGLTDAQRSRLSRLLGTWEEPDKNLGVEVGVHILVEICFCSICQASMAHLVFLFLNICHRKMCPSGQF